MRRFHFVDRDSSEWERMWGALETIAGSRADENPVNGECWQYMGSFVTRNAGAGIGVNPTDVLVHEFRHRDRHESARDMTGLASYGRILIRLFASWEYLGNWNRPMPEFGLESFSRDRRANVAT